MLALTPGITDPASLKYFDEERVLATFPDPESAYVEVIMPQKISLNLDYAARATFLSDFAVVLKSIGLVAHKFSTGLHRS